MIAEAARQPHRRSATPPLIKERRNVKKKCLHDQRSYAKVIYALSKWLVGQGVKTPPSHGGIMGSIPVRATKLSVSTDSFFTACPRSPNQLSRHCLCSEPESVITLQLMQGVRFDGIVHTRSWGFFVKSQEFSEKTCILSLFVVTC